MTNFEKYKDDILELSKKTNRIAVANGKPMTCYNTKCSKCLFYRGDKLYCKSVEGLLEWLYEEYKEPAPKLTAKERAFCEIIGGGYRDIHPLITEKAHWLVRCNKSNTMILSSVKPCRNGGCWHIEGGECLSFSTDDFSFIKFEDEPWSIEDLLKLEVE